MNKKQSYLIIITGIAVGLAGGYLYYHFIGCNSGSCAITSNPYMSMAWGGSIGYLLSDSFLDFLLKKRAARTKNEQSADKD